MKKFRCTVCGYVYDTFDENDRRRALAQAEYTSKSGATVAKDGMQIIENFLYYVAKVKITPLHTEKNLLPPAQRNALKPYIFKIIEGTDLTFFGLSAEIATTKNCENRSC